MNCRWWCVCLLCLGVAGGPGQQDGGNSCCPAAPDDILRGARHAGVSKPAQFFNDIKLVFHVLVHIDVNIDKKGHFKVSLGTFLKTELIDIIGLSW
ncbi:hypothetical protein E2C01_006000 [Portunus trituberculatus]|uniref:Secreted protein n=1 Tax=Portunus trituberculatus TaxID=210409 RepID=A0A5B7CU43_PORTR|nr:hypothetical protein [Portunus trituberculatus]